MVSNAEMLASAGAVLESFGVQKSSTHTTTTMGVSEFMNRKVVEELVDLTVSQSQWLSAMTVRTRSQRAGEIPRMILNDIVTEGVPENGNRTVDSTANPSFIEYACKKYQATWYLTMETIREARASGESNFEGKLRAAFALAMGNDMAKWSMRGDTLLDDSTRLNRLLRQRDGWLKRARGGSAIRSSTTVGSPYADGLWAAMLSAMPEEYSDDAQLRWLIPRALDIEHTEEIASGFQTGGSALADRGKVQRERYAPRGIPQLIIPQLPTDQGFATLNANQAVVGTVTSPSSNVQAVVTNSYGGYSASHIGRVGRLTNINTGQSELVAVQDSGGSALVVVTQGTLGQSTVSTTSTDYTFDIADTTSAMLCNPANLFVVLCDQMRAYRKFEQEAERWRIDVYYEADTGIFNGDALVLQDGIITPTRTFGS